jgi:hypothetical protein
MAFNQTSFFTSHSKSVELKQFENELCEWLKSFFESSCKKYFIETLNAVKILSEQPKPKTIQNTGLFTSLINDALSAT